MPLILGDDLHNKEEKQSLTELALMEQIKRLDLNPNPEVPLEAPQISTEQKARFLSLYDAKYRKFGEAEINSLRYIFFRIYRKT